MLSGFENCLLQSKQERPSSPPRHHRICETQDVFIELTIALNNNFTLLEYRLAPPL
jgi:hypothetical protein